MPENIKHKEAIFASLEKVANKDKVVKWYDLWQDLGDVIVKCYDGRNSSSYKSYWKGQIKKAIVLHDFKIAQDEDNNSWLTLEQKFNTDMNQKDQLSEASSGATSEASSGATSEGSSVKNDSGTKSSTSSLNYQKKLTSFDKQKIDTNFKKITNKWSLSSGKIVEDVVYECSKDFLFEHPSHSIIFNVKDPKWAEKFNDSEKVEIEAASDNDLLSKRLPENLSNILNQLNGKTTFKEIYDTFNIIEADPIETPDEYWVKQSVLEYINLFIDDDKLTTFNTEQDLLDEVYGYIKKSRRISKTKTETASGSAASSEYKNKDRTIGSNDKEERQIPCEHADLVFKYLSNEIGCVEIGLKDLGPNGTKELNERELKTPKMIKNFYSRLLSQYLVKIDGVKTVGIVISGLYISAMIMNFEHGSTSLLSISKRLKMPESLNEIACLLPQVLKLVYNCAQVIKSTIFRIKETTSSVHSEVESDNGSYFPPCFFSDDSSRKRKRT